MATSNVSYERQINRPSYQYKVKPKTKKAKATVEFTGREKRTLLLGVLLVGVILIGAVMTSAFASDLAYNNNQIRKANSVITGEIETLRIEIQSSNNIGVIEEKAGKMLGMVNPEGSSFVEISERKAAAKNLGVALKKRAFN